MRPALDPWNELQGMIEYEYSNDLKRIEDTASL